MLYYKIVGIHEDTPDEPTVYRGSFQESSEEPTMQALAQEFGEPGASAEVCLQQWSGGEVSYWLEDLEDLMEEPNRWMCLVGSTTYHIFVDREPEAERMKLYRTVCSTDWKGRPNHMLTDLGAGTKEELIRRMDQDIREWMAQEVVRVQIGEAETQDTDEETLALQLQDDPELADKWKNKDHFEMQIHDGDGHREFVERLDGDCCTTVYHLNQD